jgi:[ribosomal protein S5]-alanine N-acetyltransferase
VNDIETPRLLLRLVPLAGLAATAAKDKEACARLIAPRLPAEWFEDAWVFDLRLNQWKDNPAYAPWSIRAMVLKETGEIVGTINCHDMPQSFEYGGEESLMIEMGYSVFEAYRRHGIAYEAIMGFARFARSEGVRWVRLSISPGNEASLALARKLKAEKIGSQIDEIDGPEDVYLFEVLANTSP